MRISALFVGLVLVLAPLAATAQEIKFWKGAFDANFVIDSTFTTDGKTFEVSASGDAGPYGRADLSTSLPTRGATAIEGSLPALRGPSRAKT